MINGDIDLVAALEQNFISRIKTLLPNEEYINAWSQKRPMGNDLIPTTDKGLILFFRSAALFIAALFFFTINNYGIAAVIVIALIVMLVKSLASKGERFHVTVCLTKNALYILSQESSEIVCRLPLESVISVHAHAAIPIIVPSRRYRIYIVARNADGITEDVITYPNIWKAADFPEAVQKAKSRLNGTREY